MKLKCIVLSIFLFSGFSNSADVLTYKAMSGVEIGVNKKMLDDYNSVFSMFLSDLKSCNKFSDTYLNPTHGTKSEININGERKGRCFVEYNLNSAYNYKCLLNKKQIAYYIKIKNNYINKNIFLETFSEDEKRIFNDKSCVVKILSESEEVSDKDLDEIIKNQPNVGLLLKTLGK
jgi:hypothetical protein